MSKQFQWKFDTETNPPTEEPRHGSGGTAVWRRGIPALLAILALATTWLWLRAQNLQAQQVLRENVQAVLDLGQLALERGDGKLYFELHESRPDWLATQLTASQQNMVRAGRLVTKVEQPADTIWANVTWEEAGDNLQRIQFFSWHMGQLREVATDTDYWGRAQSQEQLWGELSWFSTDAQWAEAIGAHVADTIDLLCAVECATGRLPLKLQVRSDAAATAEPGHITMPSPRLVGLDADGRPSHKFWTLLDEQLADQLIPGTVRFAIPPPHLQRIDYEAAAAAFMRENASINLELVVLDDISSNAEQIAQYDGAAIVPPLEWITGGIVRDLTDFAWSDPAFDRADFYEQIWQGAIWGDRLWFMPLAADMPLVFFHRDAYVEAGLIGPTPGWTWADLKREAMTLRDGRLESGAELTWGYLDQGFSTLYAFAFSQQEACRNSTVRPCAAALSDKDIAAALAWYAEFMEDGRTTPDISQLPATERERLLINSLFRTALWVDSPVYFEHRSLMFPMGVAIFPGEDGLGGSTPLWTRGGFISSSSKRPLAVWEWLKFLSDQPPMARYRLIPARPSVANTSGYWGGLPGAIGEPMRLAFPSARPVRLADQGAFSWEQVGKVATGAISAEEAVSLGTRPAWFDGSGRDRAAGENGRGWSP